MKAVSFCVFFCRFVPFSFGFLDKDVVAQMLLRGWGDSAGCDCCSLRAGAVPVFLLTDFFWCWFIFELFVD